MGPGILAMGAIADLVTNVQSKYKKAPAISTREPFQFLVLLPPKLMGDATTRHGTGSSAAKPWTDCPCCPSQSTASLCSASIPFLPVSFSFSLSPSILNCPHGLCTKVMHTPCQT